MRIAGLQKLTLLDYPGRVACTVFCPACNFRCPFCHNSPLVLQTGGSDIIPTEEILAFLKKRIGVLEGVAITGGEPLLQNDIEEFMAEIKAMGYKIKLDTNGSFPNKLEKLISAGLVDRVAMDIKNAPEKYAFACGLENMDISAVTSSKNLLLEGRVEYEFRTTVVKGIHTLNSLRGAAEWIKGAPEYYLQAYKQTENVINPSGLSEFGAEELRLLCEEVRTIIPNTEIRGI